MKPYDLDRFLEHVDGKETVIFRCYRKQIAEVQEQLKDAGIDFYICLGNSPERVIAVYVSPKNNAAKKGKKQQKVQIGVRVVPDDHEELNDACECFQKKTGLKLVYYGESRSVITDKMIKALFCSRRAAVDDSQRKALLEAQDYKCALCGEKNAKMECDHITPLVRQGTNHISNLRMLCAPCHAGETDTLLRDGVSKQVHLRHTIESHLSPELYKQLHKAPKPAEVSWGKYDSTKELQKMLAGNKDSEVM